MQLKQGIDKGTEAVVAFIRSEATPVADKKEIAQIAINGGRDGGVIVEGVRRAQQEHHNDRYGYDVLTDRYEDIDKGFSLDFCDASVT